MCVCVYDEVGSLGGGTTHGSTYYTLYCVCMITSACTRGAAG